MEIEITTKVDILDKAVEAAKDVLWNELCPGIRRSVEDDRVYTIAARAALVAAQPHMGGEPVAWTHLTALLHLKETPRQVSGMWGEPHGGINIPLYLASPAAAQPHMSGEPVAWAPSKPSGSPDGDLDWARIRTGRTEYFNRPLYAAPLATREDWQSIGTLPNTDELILAWCPPDSKFTDGRMMIWRASILFDQRRRIAAGEPQPDHLIFPATDWRHLPSPPHSTH